MSAKVGRVIAERYRLDGLIGQGGMSSVFAAFDLRLERPVAVKLIHGHELDEQARVRFLREARAAAQLQSPHVMATYDVGVDGEEVYLVLELLSGTSFNNLLSREGPLDPRRAVGLAVQICKALSVIHSAGFVHPDIRPWNLLLATTEIGDDRVVLADFGIVILEEPDRASMMGTGIPAGNPAYLAPEQVRGVGELDARTDVFSLGTTLFTLLTGEHPIHGNTTVAVLNKIVFEEPPAVPDDRASRELQGVVHRCLAKAPEDRYPSAVDLMAALLATPEGREGYTPPKVQRPTHRIHMRH